MDNPEPAPDLRPLSSKRGATHGDMRFATPADKQAAALALSRSGMMIVEVDGIGSSARGRLGEVIGEMIERALVACGAPGPGVSSAQDMDATLSDQLFRARRAGATGIVIVVGPLRGAAGALGALEPVDCAALRCLALATHERSIVLLLDAGDAATSAYDRPVPLSELFPDKTPPAAPPQCDDSWLGWALRLGEARGPQPLHVLERIFADAYVPLANAIEEGLGDPRARVARDTFRDTFATGYIEAFPTFSVTTKRPRMVFDAHDIAARIARLHGAKTTRMLLVDSMRFDLCRAIQERLLAAVGTRAALTDELILWSALPTTTVRQLETVARGIDALRTPSPLEHDAEPPRGRTADHIRRIRVGSRELHKLDLVESRLQSSRGEVRRAIPEIAAAAAEVISRHVETLAPRTLLFVFGDHGFAIDKTGIACQGGASPEEVLVGAFGLLVGDVH